jgi:ribose transport system ATP-binding protein
MTAAIAEAPTGRLVRAMVGRDLADFYPPRAAKPPGPPALVIKAGANDDLIDINLTVHAGEIVGVAGLEGAGKSALGRAIAGDEPFAQGAVEIAGKALTPRSPRSAIEAGIGRLSEDRKREGLLTQQSLRDNANLILRAFASPFRAPGAEAMSNADTDRRLTQLDVRAASFGQEAGRLSGGNQQKVIVARWLARDPQVLVFSEPTRGIDVAAKAAIYQIMRDLADRGRAILMISSDLPEIAGVSDRIVVMREGHIAGELPGGASEEDVMAIAVGHDAHQHLGAA